MYYAENKRNGNVLRCIDGFKCHAGNNDVRVITIDDRVFHGSIRHNANYALAHKASSKAAQISYLNRSYPAALKCGGTCEMKSLIIIFAATMLIIATPYVFQSIRGGVTEDYSQSVAGVSTLTGQHTANITLGRAIFSNDTASVTGITSNVSSDTPTAYSYNSVSRQLEISGLADGATRTVVASFLIGSTILPSGSGSLLLTLLTWFWIFLILGTVGGAIYAFFD